MKAAHSIFTPAPKRDNANPPSKKSHKPISETRSTIGRKIAIAQPIKNKPKMNRNNFMIYV